LTTGAFLLVLAGGVNLVSVLERRIDALTTGWAEIVLVGRILSYAAGGGMILMGVVRWCHSLLEMKNNAVQRLRQLACLKSLMSVINHRGELDQIFKDFLPTLMRIMEYRMGVIFKPTFHSSEMELVAHHGVPAQDLFSLFDLYTKNMWYKECIRSREVTTTRDVKSLPEYSTLCSDGAEIRSFACVPIKLYGKMLGVIGLYDSRPHRFSYQEIQFLSTVGEVLGLAARQTLTSDRNKIRRNYLSLMENMLKISQEAVSLEDAFPQISAELKRIIDFDHISLALTLGSRENMKRISMGTSGGMLVDKRTGVPTQGSTIGKVLKSGEVQIDHNLDLSESSSEDPLAKACGIKSRIILPLWLGNSIWGALSLGHRKPNYYSFKDAKWLRLFALELSHLIQEQKLKERLKRNEDLSHLLYEFEQKLIQEENLKALLEDVAESLTRDLPKSFARVTLLSKQKDELISYAVHQIRSEGIKLKREGRFRLKDLPWHRLTLEAKRPMLVNQDDPESWMSKKEAGLILDEKVSSAVLVPLILQDKAVGIISVGEIRNWDRQPLTAEEIAFVKHRAKQVCVALKKGLLLRSNEQLREKLRWTEEADGRGEEKVKIRPQLSDLSYRISNPLTSIRGSAELLRLKEPHLSEDGLKYIRNIEKGVERIQKSLEEFLDSADSSNRSRLDRSLKQIVSH